MAEAAKKRRVIITCAVTGSVHTPDHVASFADHARSDRQRRGCRRRGGRGRSCTCMPAIRRMASRRPTPRCSCSSCRASSRQTDAVINITTGGSTAMTLEQRLAAPMRAKPEMCSLNMGSMNFGLFPMVPRYRMEVSSGRSSIWRRHAI